MKLEQNSFKTVMKLFCFGFISLCGQFKSQEISPTKRYSAAESFTLTADVKDIVAQSNR